MAKQKNFYDTYDALFQKPKWSFFPVTRTDTAKQLPNPNKKVVKPQTKKKKKQKKIFSVLLFLIISYLARFRLLQICKRIQKPKFLIFIQKLNFIFQKWLRHSL